MEFRLQEVESQRQARLQERSKGSTKLDADGECRRRLLGRGVALAASTACVDVDDLVKNLGRADYRFNKPDIAYVEEPFRIVLVLPTAPDQDVNAPFTTTEGPVVKRTAPFAQYMEATLRGDLDLKITPSEPQQRTTTSHEPTTWEWTVVPQKSGDKTLIIEVAAQLVAGADRSRVQIRTMYEAIHVQVRLGHWILATVGGLFSSIYGFAVGAATLAIAILGVLHYTGKKKADELPGVELIGHQEHHKSDSDSPPH
jgi:hypothetical protein